MNNLSNRCITIIRILLNEDSFIHASEIASKCHVSIRTVRYDIEQIKGWMKDNGFHLLSVPKKGIMIEKEYRAGIQRIIDNHSGDSFFSSDERVSLLVGYILASYKGETIEEMAEKTGVSKNTIMRDLDKTEDWFKKHNATLLRKQKKGIVLEADEAEKRNLIVEYIVESENLVSINSRNDFENISFDYDRCSVLIKNVFLGIDIKKQAAQLEKFIRDNGFGISDVNFVYLNCFIAVQKCRMAEGHLVESALYSSVNMRRELIAGLIEKSRIINTDDLDSISKKNEIAYFASITLAYIDNKGMLEDDTKNLTDKVYDYIVTRVFELTRCDITHDQDLKHSMKLHLASMIDRLKLNIPYQNVMLDDIKRTYTDSYNMCLEIFSEIYDKYGIERNENEVGFIALYINQALERIYNNKKNFRDTKVVLVCSQNKAAVSSLIDSIKHNFNCLKIVDVISAFDADSYDYSNINLILTTADLPFKVLKPLIKVNTLLTKRDVSKIENFLDRNDRSIESPNSKYLIANEVFKAIGRYYDIDSNAELQQSILSIIGNDTLHLPSLEDVLNKKFFTANIEAYDWEDAVVQSAEPLMTHNMIDYRYLEDIFELKNKYDQYAVIANGICMPHAAPNPKNKLSMSLATLKKPIHIVTKSREELDIKVVMVLAINDSVKYAKAIDEAFTLFEEYPDLADRLCKGKTARDLIDIIKNCYDNVEW